MRHFPSHGFVGSSRASESKQYQQAEQFEGMVQGRTGQGGPSKAVAADDYRDSLSDTTAPLGQVVMNGSVGGVVEASGDRDIFSVSLTAGQAYTFNLNSKATGGLTDPFLRLINGSGTVIASNDDFGGGYNSQISFTASASGTYYLQASGYGTAAGGYTLSARGPALTDDYRDSLTDTTAPLGTITVGASKTGKVETSGDRDIFSLSVTAGQTYTVNLNSGSTGGISDPYLRVLNASGTQIAENDDFGGGRNSQVTFTASSTGTVYLSAAGYGSATGNYSLSVTGATPPAGGFDIVFRYTGDPAYRAAFDEAAAIWEEAIRGDLPDFNSSQFGLIDDLLIDASVIAIDGAGGVLGRAGPDEFRSGSSLPTHGIMEFDSADLATMAANGTLVGVIAHEMGHVLGLGTLWSSLGLVRNTYDYVGANALAEYRVLSGNPNATFIPLERTGGPGTAGGHWAEDVFGIELMTGYANGSLPMSRMTIGSLADLGYTVDYAAADPYTLPSNSTGLQSLSTAEPEIFGII